MNSDAYEDLKKQIEKNINENRHTTFRDAFHGVKKKHKEHLTDLLHTHVSQDCLTKLLKEYRLFKIEGSWKKEGKLLLVENCVIKRKQNPK